MRPTTSPSASESAFGHRAAWYSCTIPHQRPSMLSDSDLLGAQNTWIPHAVRASRLHLAQTCTIVRHACVCPSHLPPSARGRELAEPATLHDPHATASPLYPEQPKIPTLWQTILPACSRSSLSLAWPRLFFINSCVSPMGLRPARSARRSSRQKYNIFPTARARATPRPSRNAWFCLGFIRANQDFSMGYRRKNKQVFPVSDPRA